MHILSLFIFHMIISQQVEHTMTYQETYFSFKRMVVVFCLFISPLNRYYYISKRFFFILNIKTFIRKHRKRQYIRNLINPPVFSVKIFYFIIADKRQTNLVVIFVVLIIKDCQHHPLYILQHSIINRLIILSIIKNYFHTYYLLLPLLFCLDFFSFSLYSIFFSYFAYALIILCTNSCLTTSFSVSSLYPIPLTPSSILMAVTKPLALCLGKSV